MIDWYVVFVPLVLLVVLLLLGFVGCVLGRHGTLPPSPDVTFAYASGLSSQLPGLPQLVSFTVAWGGSVQNGGTQQVVDLLGVVGRGGQGQPPLAVAGEANVVGQIPVDSDGSVSCSFSSFVVNANPPFGTTGELDSPPSVVAQKGEGASGPSFTLQRDGQGFIVVIG